MTATRSQRAASEPVRRAQLLGAARKVFRAEGYDGASVSEIVREAGVAQGTFYLYFPSKRDAAVTLRDGLMETMAQAVALSVFTFAGSSQFASVSVISGGGNPAAAVGGALLLAARNALYGPVVSPVLRGGAFRRAVAAQFLTDETTAMASAQDDPTDARDAFWFTGLAIMSLWVAGTVAGVLLGGILDDPGA